MKKAVTIYTIILLIIITSMFLLSCEATPEQSDVPEGTPSTEDIINPADSATIPERGFYMGILPSPRQGQSFEDVYRQTSTYSDFVPVWGRPTPFYNLPEELTGTWGEAFIEKYIRGNDMFPVINLSFIGPGMTLVSPPDITDPTLSNEAWRDAYKEAAMEVVRTVRPRYLSLGNEVNRWYEKYGVDEDNPDGFENYISLYEEIYDEVKELSPETTVFCVFAREIVSENREADMSILREFDPDKMDLLVLTSYPHAVRGVNRPSDIRDDYYSEVLQILPGKPFGFSEIAWPSLEAFGGEESQADFLGQIHDHLTGEQGIDLFLLGWPWLHDLSEGDTIGLIHTDGTPKLAYQPWRSLSLLGTWRTRQQAIPADAIKIMSEIDKFPPILHSHEYEDPVPLPYPVSTAGAEDSPFILPGGDTLYFFFTPDVRVPVEKQLLDGVTGIYKTKKVNSEWTEPERVILNNDISLDGCTYVDGDLMWFCTARRGYTGVQWFTAELVDGYWQDWTYASDQFPEDYEVGELHFINNGKEVYYHSSRPGGKGGYDIWVTRKINGEWTEPENIRILNTPENEGWPYLSQDGNELWFNRTYLGSPAVYRSRKINGEWTVPELIVSWFAGEPSLDNEGNLYFVHHYFEDGVMLEADIYIAKRK